MKYCKKCVMPDTKPGVYLDEDGVCNPCRTYERRKLIDWNARRKELEQLLKRFRGKGGNNYDCLIPVSGGKDSTWMTYMMKEVFKMNPLCVYCVPLKTTELGEKNIMNLANLGVDLIKHYTNPVVAKKLCRLSFIKFGSPTRAFDFALYSVPMRIAINFKIPLVVWGENISEEYGGFDTDTGPSAIRQDKNDLMRGISVDDFITEGVTPSDLIPYTYPSPNEFEKAGVQAIFLGYYLPWDGFEHAEFSKKLGLSVSKERVEGTYVNYQQLDDKFSGINYYLKFLKFGIGRMDQVVCADIRAGRLTREEAIELVKKYDGEFPKKYFKEFLEYIDMTEEEFWEVADSFRNKELWEKIGDKWRLKTPPVYVF